MRDEIFDRFKEKIEKLGLVISRVDDNGCLYINVGTETMEISLDNVRKSYKIEGTYEHLDSLIYTIQSSINQSSLPHWDECKDKVFLRLFPSNFEFNDFLNDPVTTDFSKIYVFYNDYQFNWINISQLEEWNIDTFTLINQVNANMYRLLKKSQIRIVDVLNGFQLAYFDSKIAGLKSSLLFSKDLKKKVSKVLGWPIYCVLPLNDFCYMFSETHKDELINYLREIVINEYNNSGYEITTEILKISDEKIEVIGKY